MHGDMAYRRTWTSIRHWVQFRRCTQNLLVGREPVYTLSWTACSQNFRCRNIGRISMPTAQYALPSGLA